MLAKFKFSIPKIIKLIFLLFNILGNFMAHKINFVANPLIFSLKTNTFGNQLY
uniref:Uncharacterized protein n=1 Tax=Physcomitrium patens TaxID=3218 RepID=A0A2K1IX00_PHYPA|nr:hypothetical protein PHYPA_023622 [Physcomitrium patens]